MEWVNWSGSQRVTPAAIERPRSRAELAAGRRRRARRRSAWRARGTRSAPPRSPTGRCSRSTRSHRVLDADAATGLVRVEAGIRLHALSRELHARGLAMPNLGDIDAQSLAGALSTGTHGTGTRLPNLSGQVESVELVLADGSERTITGGDELRAARVSLGALGVIAAVTLRCVPAFRLHNTDRPEPLEEVLDSLQERADAHDHFEFWTFPHADVALTRTHDRTEAPPNTPGRTRAYVGDVLMDNHAFRAVNDGRAPLPGHDPAAEPLRLRRRLAARARRLVLRDLRLRAARALRGDGVLASRASRPSPPSAPPARRSSATRSPSRSSCASRPPTTRCSHPRTGATARSWPCTSSGAMAYEPAFREVEAALSALGGRPHWGKRSFLSAAELAPRYPRWDAFQAVRARSRPRRPLRQRVGATRAGIAPMKTFNIFEADLRVRPGGPGRLPRRHGSLRAEDRRLADRRDGLRAAARPGAVPVPLRVRRGVGARPRRASSPSATRRARTCSARAT